MVSLQAIFGGTFNPIHYGHLLAAEMLAKQIKLYQITMMPNNMPPHRPQPEPSAEQRVEMLKLAIANRPIFKIDTRELDYQSPSWTIETLKRIRKECGKRQPIAFIIGKDSLLNLHKWRHWETLLDLCHLLVCQRPGYTDEIVSPKLKRWITQNQTNSIGALYQQSSGLIWLADTPLLQISSTVIRQRFRQNIPCYDLLPASVMDYIDHHRLYRYNRNFEYNSLQKF